MRKSSGLQLLTLPLAWVFVVALAVRLYGLTYHSLWFDEVMSTVWAARPAAEIWSVGLALSEDKHPPLYYLLLHAWTFLFGPGDVAVRLLGVLIGAAAVFPLYGIGRLLGGARAGAAGALLLAVNPFLTWYSQEARMFMPATTFALAGLYGLLRLTLGSAESATGARSSGPRYWLLTVTGLTAALYTYLFTAFLLPVAGLWVLGLWLASRLAADASRRLIAGFSALAVVALLFLPLARSAWLVSGEEAVGGQAFAGMAAALWSLLPVYAVGRVPWPTHTLNAIAAVSLTLLLLGLSSAHSSPDDDPGGGIAQRRGTAGYLPALIIGAWLAIPLLIGGLLLARDRTVFAETRYFIFLVPVLCLAWGRALAWLYDRQRWLGIALAALMLVPTLAALPSVWSPENRREAWREAAAFVAAHAGSNDAVLVQADYVHVAFERYFDGPQPVYYPFTGPVGDPAEVDPPLSGLQAYDAVWLVQSHHELLDPHGSVAGWFAARYPLISEVYPAGIVVRGYLQHYRTPGTDPIAALPATSHDFGDLRLLGCSYMPASLSPRDDLYHPPSGWVHVRSFFTPLAALTADLVPQARLVDSAGQVWGADLDRPSGAARVWPTTRWLLDETVRLDHDVNLNPATPPGAYRLVIQLPGFTDGAVCGTVQVTR